MRDTLSLRARIAVLACVPGLAGCSSSPPEADAKGQAAARQGGDEADAKEPRRPMRDAKARRQARKAEAEARQADAKLAAAEPEPTPDAPAGAAPPVASPDDPMAHGAHAPEEVLGYPGDPPFIDGYNPEEATCVSGNWCGTVSAATAVAVPSVGEAMGCVTRISGGGKTNEAIAASPKAYAGLSTAPNMQGAFNAHGTELARAKAGNDDACCYHWFEYCSGRPLLGPDGPVLAPVRSGPAWGGPAPARDDEAPALPAALRQRIAEGFRDDARAEHASIASFARATLELMAVGAPPSLLEQAQRAALDEIAHARLCFSLAARHGGAAIEPGPLPVPPPRPASLPRLAADAFAEGCVGETIAALAAQRATRAVADPEVKAALAQLADDEARHAALAWSTVAWALAQGGDAVADALRRVAAALEPGATGPLPDPDPHAATLAAHGRLDARAHALASREAWSDVIAPMLASLLAGSALA